ncbi:MAG: quercetin 2,3-dioxygenase, partial [Cyanobacteria bacterium REEB65]|nr:quercetin 2,3-dioxygenase [Cyanobacteria bacterium REEB65]
PSRDRWQILASPDGQVGSIAIRQDARLFERALDSGESATFRFEPGRLGYLQVATGVILLNGQSLAAGDGAAIEQEGEIAVVGQTKAEILLFELP